MPESLARKAPVISKQLEIILGKDQIAKSRPIDPWSIFYRIFEEMPHSQHTYFTSASTRNWLRIRNEARGLPVSELRDDFTDLRRDADALRARVEVLSKELVSTKERLRELSQEVLRLRLLGKTGETSAVSEVCEAYIEEVKGIQVVRQVLLSRCEDDESVIWTIIEGPPFDDSVRLPVYEAQLKISQSLKEDSPVDFHVVNLSELSQKQNVEDILPAHSETLWQR